MYSHVLQLTNKNGLESYFYFPIHKYWSLPFFISFFFFYAQSIAFLINFPFYKLPFMHIFKLNLTGSQKNKFYPNCDHLILAIHIKYIWLCSLKHNLVSL